MTDVHLIVFNYLNETVQARISVTPNKAEDSNYLKLEDCYHKITIEPNEIITMTCKVSSTKIGKIGLVAQVTGLQSETWKNIKPDGELRELLVVYEGIQQHITQEFLFDLTDQDKNTLKYKLPSALPREIINGSAQIFVSATTDLLSVTWQEHLKQLNENIYYDFSDPGGCCQQRIYNYFPRIFWLNYLEISNKLKETDRVKAINEINKAMAQLCWHDPNDGSSTFYEWGKHELD